MFKIYAIISDNGLEIIVYSEAQATKERRELKKEFEMKTDLYIVEHADAGTAEDVFYSFCDENRIVQGDRLGAKVKEYFTARGCAISKK